jgi:hypothetical protein
VAVQSGWSDAALRVERRRCSGIRRDRQGPRRRHTEEGRDQDGLTSGRVEGEVHAGAWIEQRRACRISAFDAIVPVDVDEITLCYRDQDRAGMSMPGEPCTRLDGDLEYRHTRWVLEVDDLLWSALGLQSELRRDIVRELVAARQQLDGDRGRGFYGSKPAPVGLGRACGHLGRSARRSGCAGHDLGRHRHRIQPPGELRWWSPDKISGNIIDDIGAPGVFGPLALPYTQWPTAVGHVTAPEVSGADGALLRSRGDGCFTLAGFPTPADSNPAGLVVDLRDAKAPRVEQPPTATRRAT